MSIIINISATLVGMALILIVVRLMIVRKIMESEAVLWILIGLIITVLGIIPGILPIIAKVFGIWYPPAILFAVAITGLVLIVFKSSVTISKQTNEINELSMQLSLLKLEIEKLKRKPQSDLIKEDGDIN